MKTHSTLLRSALLTSVLLLTLSAVALAQGQRPPRPTLPPQAAPQATQHPSQPATNPNKPPNPNFTGAAKQLGTTPEALEDAYKAAAATNATLTRGQFIAANILAKNLGTAHPTITTQAILDGLAGGKSIGETLQSLGLSADEAKAAEAEANSQAEKPSGL
jgi:hypothetical protein